MEALRPPSGIVQGRAPYSSSLTLTSGLVSRNEYGLWLRHEDQSPPARRFVTIPACPRCSPEQTAVPDAARSDLHASIWAGKPGGPVAGREALPFLGFL